MRIGLLGGVFNPPHVGHLVCAQEALIALALDEVRLVPVGQAPHRAVENDPGAPIRLELCEAAVRGDDRLRCSAVEVERAGPSYTADTLRALRDERSDDELVLLLGADQACELAGWREPEAVLGLAEVGIVARSGVGPDEVRSRLGGLSGADRLRFFQMPRIDISSAVVRRRVAEGVAVRYLVPDAVEQLIGEHGLYRAGEGAA